MRKLCSWDLLNHLYKLSYQDRISSALGFNSDKNEFYIEIYMGPFSEPERIYESDSLWNIK